MKPLLIYTAGLLSVLSMAMASPTMAPVTQFKSSEAETTGVDSDIVTVSFTDINEGGSFQAAASDASNSGALTKSPVDSTKPTGIPNYEEDYSTLSHEGHMSHEGHISHEGHMRHEAHDMSLRKRREVDEDSTPEMDEPCPHHDNNMHTNLPLVGDVANTLTPEYRTANERHGSDMAMRRRREAIRFENKAYDETYAIEQDTKPVYNERRERKKIKESCDLECPKFDFSPVCAGKSDCVYEFPNICILKKYQCLYPRAGLMQQSADRCKITWAKRCDPQHLGSAD